MKIRTSFVSNSSSSSFVCQVTGAVVDVENSDLASAGMTECINGHVFTTVCLIPADPSYPPKETMLEKLDEVTDSKQQCKFYRTLSLSDLRTVYDREVRKNATGESNDAVSADQCPICTLAHVKDDELLAYLLKGENTTRKAVTDIIKRQFGTHEEFVKHISGK